MRYVASPRPPRAWVGTGFTAEMQPTLHVIEADKDPVPVGLVDSAGVPLYRVPDTVPMGFRAKEKA